MMPNRTTALIVLRCTGLLCLSSLPLSTAMAQAGWNNVGQVRVTAESDDNPRLVPEGFEESDSIGILDASLTTSFSGQRGDFSIVPRVRVRSYGNERNEDLGGNDYFLRSFAEYRWSVVRLGVRADLSEQSIRSSEIADATPQDPDIDDLQDVSAGTLFFLDRTQERTTAAPYIEFNISDRNSFRFDAQFDEISYTGPGAANLTDFSNNTLAANLVRSVNARNSVTARVFATSYESARLPDENGDIGTGGLFKNETDIVGVEGIFSRPITETWTLNLTAGVQRADFLFFDNGEIVDNADSGFAYRLGFRRRSETTATNIDVRRQLSPNSNGFVLRRDEFWIYSRRAFSERVSGNLGFRYSESRGLDNAPDSGDRDYARAELGIEWAITQRLFVNVGYDYVFQEFVESSQAEAQSNSVYVGFTFRSSP